jgi:threonylcarbamoyladenosine tRNA methylthiotransferase MtaB
VVTGCYSEISPAEVEALGVDLIVPNHEKDQLIQKVMSAGLLIDDGTPPVPDATFHLPESRTRAFIKVQDGCENRCTFCIVTIARGGGRSRKIAEVIAEIRQLEELGFQEVVLTGVHLGSFGHDQGNRRGLRDLVQTILDKTHIARVRLSSLEPWDLDDDFFQLWANPRLCRHLHLPLQSGCDQTLKRMARRTSQAEFSALVHAARQAIPGLSITTDLIVGFPGETAAEFAESLAFVDAMAFSGMHIFRFSPREGTVAYKMKGQISAQISKERSQQVHEVTARHERAFRQSMIGQSHQVLWETCEETPGGYLWSGLTDNYIRTIAFSTRSLANTITPATLTHLLADAVAADLPGEPVPLRLAVT